MVISYVYSRSQNILQLNSGRDFKVSAAIVFKESLFRREIVIQRKKWCSKQAFQRKQLKESFFGLVRGLEFFHVGFFCDNS